MTSIEILSYAVSAIYAANTVLAVLMFDAVIARPAAGWHISKLSRKERNLVWTFIILFLCVCPWVAFDAWGSDHLIELFQFGALGLAFFFLGYFVPTFHNRNAKSGELQGEQ